MLSEKDIGQLNSFQGFFGFETTWIFRKFINCDAKNILLTTGNQFGKTGSVAYSYALRILGMHPVARRNILYYECVNEAVKCDLEDTVIGAEHLVAPYKYKEDITCPSCSSKLRKHKRLSHTFRFCSENLPGQSSNISKDGESAEVKNTQYPEFKKWLPKNLIKKDITFRIPSMIVADPYGGKDIIIEFVSYNQSTQAMAGVQRVSIWCDEAPGVDFYEEQLPRLISENGDIIFTYTPADRASWLFDEFFDKARIFYRSKTIADYLSTDDFKVKQIEHTDSPYDIAVIQAATDDNPTLSVQVIEDTFAHIDDPDTIAIRRYGIFKQLSGRIFKDFEYSVHYLEKDKYFPEGLPSHWTFGQGVDYHPQTKWAYGAAALSPENEMFIWTDWNPSPEFLTIRKMAHEIARLGKDYKFRLSIMDPLSKATKLDNVTALDDFNRAIREFSYEGIGRGGYWNTWDTKGERGRDVLRQRLKNSKQVGRPFNNKTSKDGRTIHLPTLWILDTCNDTAKSFRNWRWQEWGDAKSQMTKEEKNTPEQKWSHFCMVFEALCKESSWKPPVRHQVDSRRAEYFRMR